MSRNWLTGTSIKKGLKPGYVVSFEYILQGLNELVMWKPQNLVK